MLAQKYRFHGYGSLKFLYHKGKTYRTRTLALRVAKNDRRSNGRVAVVVTKKVQKAAPRRNRIRRRVYEIIRKNWNHIAPAHDILISVYDPNTNTMSHEQLEKSVIDLLQQAGIWQDAE